MRKFTLLIIAAFLVSAANAQTRSVLIQKGSNASCAPCAAANPAFWTLMQPNMANHKVVYLAYQWDFPGVDPMNAHNPTDPDAFMAFYAQNGVPTCLTDGQSPRHIANHTQALIDAAYAVPTPLSMTISHTMNSTFTSATINITVTNNGATAVGGGQYVLRTVFTEEQIDFATAPGTNGERTFHHVARKHLPSWAGTPIPSIPAGGTETFTLTEAVPGYYYDISKLNVVAYVQNNADKIVWQSAESTKIPVPLNASITGATIASPGYCNATITPKARLTNVGTDPVTSATVGYTINGGTPVTQAWTGNLATGASADITFAPANLSGNTSIVYTATNINGGTDLSLSDNTTAAANFANIDGTPAAIPYSQGFESFTTVDVAPRSIGALTLDYAANDFIAIKAVGSTGTRSVFWNAYDAAVGVTATFTVDKVALGSAPSLSFKAAHRKYQTANDVLKVLVSTNCGQNWTEVWSEGSALLHSSTTATTRYTTPLAAEWMTKTVNLNAYANQNVWVAFRCISGYGNNIFVDDINITNTVVSVEDLAGVNAFNLFPNPTSGDITVEFNLENNASVDMNIANALGQQVKTVLSETRNSGANRISVPTSDLAAGTYFFNVLVDGKVQTQRFVVIK
jgi:Secretion system C-terminal sorting domain/Outer membrane protein Omp28